MERLGFKQVKWRLLQALKAGSYQHEVRDNIDTRNLLQTGAVSAADLILLVERCNGTHHSSSPHHMAPGIQVHVLKRDGWYLKFYFVDPDTVFISVHL